MINYKKLVPFGIAIVAIAGILLNINGFAVASPANKLSESPTFLGHVELVAKDADGNIKAYRQTDNIVVNIGKTCAAERIFGASGNNTACAGGATAFDWLALGTSPTTETAGDTALLGPLVPRSQVALASKTMHNGTGSDGGTATSPYYSLQNAFTGFSATIAEAGIFDASTNGHMFARKTFTGIPLQSSDTLTVTWRIQMT